MTLQLDHPAFAPGEPITGLVQWQLPEPPEILELRLVWKTSGKGSVDMGTVPLLQVQLQGDPGQHQLSVLAPLGPWSYSGSLLSIVWTVELFLYTRDCESDRSEHAILIAPNRPHLI